MGLMGYAGWPRGAYAVLKVFDPLIWAEVAVVKERHIPLPPIQKSPDFLFAFRSLKNYKTTLQDGEYIVICLFT